MSAAVTHVNASVSLPGVAALPTSAYWHENIGAIVIPASKLQTIPAGTDRATISGALQATAITSSAR